MFSYGFNRLQWGVVGVMTSAMVSAIQLNGMAATQTQNLTLVIGGLRSQAGVVCVALFKSETGFPSDGTQAIRNSCVKITTLPLMVNFDLPYGNYAVSLLHDENEDGRLNTGFLGIPKEGIGFSNNPRIFSGAPKFATARFTFTQNNTNLQVSMKYLRR
jgi:uncharacterized protein (DUF2141 family)